MPEVFRFETPENVQVQYAPAGLGTRFLAWLVDQVVVMCGTVILIFIALAVGLSFGTAFDGLSESFGSEKVDRVLLYFLGLIMLLWGLGSFVYFGCCEYVLRGQTVGKRISGIRVIKSDGFQLDASSILVRNLFRVLDHVPPMWCVPLLSRVSQRAGDMVAGTLVVTDQSSELSTLRTAISERSAVEASFRFTQRQIQSLTHEEIHAIERVLERLSQLSNEEKHKLLGVFAKRIAAKLEVEVPRPADRQRFLEDLFAAELRRQNRAIG